MGDKNLESSNNSTMDIEDFRFNVCRGCLSSGDSNLKSLFGNDGSTAAMFQKVTKIDVRKLTQNASCKSLKTFILDFKRKGKISNINL